MGQEKENSTELSAWIQRTIKVARIVQKYGEGVKEFELKEGPLSIKLKREPRMNSVSPAQIPATETPAEAYENPSRYYKVQAPFTGIFYRQERPGLPPYVIEGDYVEKGQSVGLIEAMKVFNKMETEESGLLVRIFAENGDVVQEGFTLMVIDKQAPKPQVQPYAAT